MIVAAGLSPAWQQIYVFDRLQPGEVNRAVRTAACASGKVLNVALAVHQLGADGVTVCVVGGVSGRAIQDEWSQRGLNARWVESATPTRTCTTVIETQTGRTTELVENCGPVTEKELSAFENEFVEVAAEASVVVLIGSLPTGTPSDFYRRLLDRTAATVVLDARGPELLKALDRQPFVVKPNRAELARTVDRDLNDEPSVLAAARELTERGAEWVLVTDGSRPALLVSQREAFRVQPLPARTVNPIGCGDCLAAGVAVGLEQGRSVLDAVRLGMAAAAENLSQLLPARLSADRAFSRWQAVRWERV